MNVVQARGVRDGRDCAINFKEVEQWPFMPR